jgi:2-polyprenyl-6-methoxyphenol hydroxylase-like FAD-dependent oxidoreductase
VLRHDLRYLPRPLPSYVKENVVLLGDAAHAMTPNLGQGGAQAIEDAVVLGQVAGRPGGPAEYDARRRRRSQSVAAASLRGRAVRPAAQQSGSGRGPQHGDAADAAEAGAEVDGPLRGMAPLTR